MIRFATCLILLLSGTGVQAQCRQALALGLDVSGSVDAREYRLQMEGLAQALDAPSVRGALLDTPGSHVTMMVYEWSGPGDNAVVLPWTPVTSALQLDTMITTLRNTSRREASPGTALGDAMVLGAGFLAMHPECWRHTLDISGDGKSNLGARPRDVKPALEKRGLTINALVIGVDAPQIGDIRQTEIAELSSYFRADVILGPNAFVETSLGFENYADAMRRKLERELETMVLSYGPTYPSPLP